MPGDSRKNKPFVLRDGQELSLHFSQPVLQSNMNLAEPDALTLGYTRTMMGFLLFAPEPATITMIGLGGGSLPKFCYRHLPASRIAVAEINPDVIALRDEFLIPRDDERFQIVCADGARLIRQRHASEDVIVVDGYDIGGHAPALCTASFYADCRHALTDNGVMVVNLFGAAWQNDSIVRTIRQVFNGLVFVVESEDVTNQIVFALKGLPPGLSQIRLYLTAIALMSQMPIDFHRTVVQLLSDSRFQ